MAAIRIRVSGRYKAAGCSSGVVVKAFHCTFFHQLEEGGGGGKSLTSE